VAKLSKPEAQFLLPLAKGPELVGILSQMIHTFAPSIRHVRN